MDHPLYEYFMGKCLVYGRPVLERRFGERRARDLTREAREGYFALSAQIPRLRTLYGRLNLMTAVVALPVYRALQGAASGPEALELAGNYMAACAVRGLAEDLPMVFRMILENRHALPVAARLVLAWDNLADDTAGWRFEVLPPPPGHLLAVNALRCGVHGFLTAQGAPELTERAVCPLDDIFCRECLPQGTRLCRTMLISRGDAYCDFRFLGRAA